MWLTLVVDKTHNVVISYDLLNIFIIHCHLSTSSIFCFPPTIAIAILLFFTIAFMLHSQRFSHPMSFLVLSVSHCVVLLFVPITDDDETLTQVSALNEGKSKRKSTTKSKKTLGGNRAVCLVGNDWELFFYTNIKLTYSKDLIWIEIKTENRWLVMPNSFGYDFTALVGVDNSLWLTTVIISHGNSCWVLSEWQTALLWCELLAQPWFV